MKYKLIKISGKMKFRKIIGLSFILASAVLFWKLIRVEKDVQISLEHGRSLIDNGWSKGGVSYDSMSDDYYKRVYEGDKNAWIETTLDGDSIAKKQGDKFDVFKGKYVILIDYIHDEQEEPWCRDDIRRYRGLEPPHRYDHIEVIPKDAEDRNWSYRIYPPKHSYLNGPGAESGSEKYYEKLEQLCKKLEL